MGGTSNGAFVGGGNKGEPVSVGKTPTWGEVAYHRKKNFCGVEYGFVTKNENYPGSELKQTCVRSLVVKQPTQFAKKKGRSARRS